MLFVYPKFTNIVEHHNREIACMYVLNHEYYGYYYDIGIQFAWKTINNIIEL